MTPYLEDSDVRLYQGDSLEVLRSMPDASVHMACTSPPFFGLRDYGTGEWDGGDPECDHRIANQRGAGRGPFLAAYVRPESGKPTGGAQKMRTQVSEAYGAKCGKCGARRIDSQIGLESSPDEWAARLVDVFREVRRVLRDDGTLWVECGDSYASQGDRKGGGWNGDGMYREDGTLNERPTKGHNYGAPIDLPKSGLKAKDLIGQPFQLAFALRADGWYLRSCIIWSKPNAMPESVTDRPTTGHSYVFLFSKRPRYFYDAEALREPAEWARWGDQTVPKHDGTQTASGWIQPKTKDQLESVRERNGQLGRQQPGNTPDRGGIEHAPPPGGKNARTVWTIPTEPNALAICRVCDAYWQGGAPREHCGEPVVQHFAAFPRELVRRMILAGTSERGVCAECGAPWVREVERDLVATKGKVGEHAGEGRADPMDSGSNQVWSGGVYGRYDVTTLGWHSSCDCQVRGEVLRGKTTPQQHSEASLAYLAPVPAVVLDCFSGSGTTLLVARSLGRYSVGIELNERYAAMTRARMSQLSLLSELA